MYTDEELKEFFVKMPKRPLPNLSECICHWAEDVIKMSEWTEISIDDYLYFLTARERIENLLDKEIITADEKEILEKSDDFFKKITTETKNSIFCNLITCEEYKRKYWFVFRLLKSKYDQWLLYARF